MKIIFCLHHFLPGHVGGTEIYTLRLAQELRLKEIEAIVLVPGFDSAVTDSYIWEGIRVIRYAENSIEDRKMIMGKTAPAGLKIFSEIVKEEQPDIIHFHELAPGRGINIFHVEKAHELKVPVVLSFHVSSYTCLRGSLNYKGKEKCDGVIKIKRCTACIYQSRNITGLKETLLSTAAFTLLAAGIDPTRLNTTVGTALGFPFVIRKIKNDLLKLSAMADKIVVLAEWYKHILEKNEVPASKLLYIKQGLTSGAPPIIHHKAIALPLRIVYIGRVSEMKGVHLLIAAVGKLPEEKITLHIYGPETEDAYVTECKQQTKSKRNIHWMGTLPPENVIPALSAYHLLCLPSAFEMSPLVIQEAFAAGLPVLASDVYGNAEQIKEGINGWLFRFKDSDHLAEKLSALINDPVLVEKARRALPEVSGFTNIADRHVELYSAVINSRDRVPTPVTI